MSYAQLIGDWQALVVLFVVCVLAILIPSYRATRLDPMIALQAE